MKYDICVVGGAGRVGLPLSIAFADKGLKVCIYDINKSILEKIKKGIFPFKEENAQNILNKVLKDNKLFFSEEKNVIKNSDIIIFTIGTPVDNHFNPEYGLLKKIENEFIHVFRDDQLIVLRSTVYPGFTEKFDRILKKNNLKTELAFCPERIVEGQALRELSELPQIISSFSDKGYKRAYDLFSYFTEDIVNLNPLEAELAKLFCNVYRYVKFATANQFYMIANDMGVDFHRIYEGMTHNYDRAKDFPTPGFSAGPCLFKDTAQLASFNLNNFFLGNAAMLINEGFPNYIIQKLREKFNLKEKNVGILGMSFKKDSDDIKESLSYKLKKILTVEVNEVYCSDPNVDDDRFIMPDELIEKSDIVIVAVPHTSFYNLDFKEKYVVDPWNMCGEGGII